MISPWRRRDNFSVARHQEIVDQVNLSAIVTATGELQSATGGGRTIVDSRRPIVEEIFFGAITDTGPNGESDWPDARYFVQRKVPTMPAVTTNPITMEDDVNPEAEMTSDGSGNAVVDDIVTATHPAELADATHNLKVGDPVTVATVYAYDDDKLYKVYLIMSVEETCAGTDTTTIGGSSEGSEAADTTSFDFTTGTGTNTATLELWFTSRVAYFEAGDEKLYGYARKLTFSCEGGKLVAKMVSGETRYEVDVPESC